MRFSLFGFNNNIQKERQQYVKQYKVEKEIIISPCSKFVACIEKLSRNYVLALREHGGAETLQVANRSDVEFFEGYEFADEYTDSVRRHLSKSSYKIYQLFARIIESINRADRLLNNDNKSVLNDIKLNLSSFNNIILNIYQHLTMNNDVPQVENNDDIPNGIEKLLQYIKELILQAVEELTFIGQGIIIDYITKQIDSLINKLLLYYEKISMI